MKVEKKNVIPLDLLIPPGETIADILKERNMTAAELAARTGFPQAYIHRVIRGEQAITNELAERLAATLDVPSSFWMNLQVNYDAECRQTKKLSSDSGRPKR